MEFQIGQTVRNKITGKVEIVNSIKHGYINKYRADLWEITDSSVRDINDDTLPGAILTDVCLKNARWNKKFYGNNIYVNNVKYKVTPNQMAELSKHAETDY